MKNMKYAYASLMAIISIILLLSSENIKITFEKAFAFGGVVIEGYNRTVSTQFLPDGNGNVYFGGNFSGSLTLGSTTLTATGAQDIFLVKYDTNRNIIWSKTIGVATKAIYYYNITQDTNGDLYLLGYFPVDNGTSIGGITLDYGQYIIKIDKDNGSILQAVRTPWNANKIAAHDGQIYLVGGIFGSDTISGTTYLAGGGVASTWDAYLIKYNATSGNVLWTKTITAGSGNSTWFNDVIIDGAGNVYLGGNSYSSGIYVGATNSNGIGSNILINNSGGNLGYIIKYDTSGNLIWSQGIFQSGSSSSPQVSGMSLDQNGDIYVGGNYTFTDILLGTTSLISNGLRNGYLGKIKSNDGSISFAKTIGFTDYGNITDIAIKNNGDVYIGGYFTGTTNIGNATITTSGSYDAFLAQTDSGGNVGWVRKFGGGGNDEIRGISIDTGGEVLTYGSYGSTGMTINGITLNGTGGTYGNGITDTFLVKYYSDGSFDGGGFVNGACVSLPSNGVYYNNSTSYTLVNAASGTSLTASYNANPTINTCQFKCGTGTTWNGSSCVASAPTSSGVTIGSLHWEKVTENTQIYEYHTGAIQYCSGLAPAGKWRIPSNNDFIASITTLGSTGAFNDTIELTGNTKVWSSTPQTGDPSRPGQALYSTGGIGLWYAFTDAPGWANRLICVVNTSDWTGSLVNGACTSLPSNAVYYNSGTNYTLVNAASGTSLTASYNANPTINTCQFRCNVGYSWNSSSCVISASGSAPTIVSPTGLINTTTPTYSGSGGSGAVRVEVRTVGGTLIASGANTSTGYSLRPILELSEGANVFLVTGYDSLGASGSTITGSVTVDTIAPANPIILSHASGATVTSQSFTLTGSAETGSTVRVTISTGNVYSGVASSTGAWNILVNFPVGTSYPRFTATDSAGNTSTGITLTLITTNSGDITAPAAPIVTSHITGMSVSGSITLSGTAEAWSMVSIYNSGTLIASAQASSSGVWSNIVNLVAGQNNLTLYATDGAGNRSVATGLVLYSVGGTSFSGITITSPVNNSTYSYSNIIAYGSGTPGNTIIVATPGGNISSLIGTNGSWSVQINLVAGNNLLTFYERGPTGILSIGVNRTVIYDTSGSTPETPINPGTEIVTPIGSYIPSKNDPSIQDHTRLEQLPSDRMCALDEHVKLNRIITSDIKGSWAEGYIRTLIRFWVIKNTEKFYPHRSITRGEFLALTVRSLRCNYATEELDYAVTSSFEDVPEDHWANKYLAIAEQYGWLPSDTSSDFRPDHFITRAEAMDFVAGATGLYDSEGADEFSDITYLSEAIQEAILTAQKYDIIHGIRKFSSWYFYPDYPLTRAEAAKIIQRTFVR